MYFLTEDLVTAVSMTVCPDSSAAVLLGQNGLTHSSYSNWTDPDWTHHLFCLECPAQGMGSLA